MLIKPNELFLYEGNHIAFSNGSETITFTEFKKNVKVFAEYFSKLPDEKIALFVRDNMYWFAVTFFALIQANKQIVLAGSKKQIEASVEFQSLTLVSDQKFEHDFKLIYLEEIKSLFNQQSEFILHKMTGDEKVSFFTSGSTGSPKEIKKSISTLFAEICNISSIYKSLLAEHKDVTMIATVQPFHMYGMLWRFLFPIINGITIDTDLILLPEELQIKLETYKEVLFATVPVFMQKIVEASDLFKFEGKILKIFSSGSLLSKEVSDGIYKIFAESPYEIFGSTETGGVAYRQQFKTNLWTVFDVVKIKQSDDQCMEVTSDFIEGKHFKMSDVIDLVDENHFHFLGRSDRIVKTAGKRISLEELESQYKSHEFVQEAYVLELQPERLGALFVLSDQGKEFFKEKHTMLEFIAIMRKHILQFVENSVVPRRLRFSEEIPKNTQGKVNKSEVITMLESTFNEPIIYDLKLTKNNMSADILFLRDSKYFQGHFPQIPILPGVVQLHVVSYFIKKFWQVDVTALEYSLKRIKFTKIMFPEQLIKLSITKSETGFSFVYERDGVCSSGMFNV